MFTIMLLLVLVYWVVFLFGFLDLEALGGAHGAGDGAADGALEGAADGAAHGAAEAHGVGDGHDLGDGHHGGHEGGHHGGGHEGGLIPMLGLRSVPVTVAWSFVTLFGWGASILMMRWFGSAWSPWLAVPVVGGAALAVGVLAASVAVRPLARVFREDRAPVNLELVGKVCRITTTRVAEDFGQGAIREGGAEILLQIRNRDQNLLNLGDEALIIDYDPLQRIFYVEPMARLLPPTDPKA